MAKAVSYGAWRADPPGAAEFPDTRGDEAAAAIAEALGRAPDWLGATRSTQLLACYGIAIADVARPRRARAAGEGAAEAGRARWR